jgi:hypothetical protein
MPGYLKSVVLVEFYCRGEAILGGELRNLYVCTIDSWTFLMWNMNAMVDTLPPIFASSPVRIMK